MPSSRSAGAQARLSVAVDQIAVDAHLLDLVRQRAARGVGNDREVAEAEALLAQAKATVPVLKIVMEAQTDRLDVLTGLQPGSTARELAETRDAAASIPSLPINDRPVDVLRRRPDVIAAERRLAASNARIGEALSDYYPKLSLAGLLGFDSLSANQLFTAKAFEPIGTAALRWRLFDFGKVDAEVREARGARAEALSQYRLQVLHAAEDVEVAFTTLAQTEGQDRATGARGRRPQAVEDPLAAILRRWGHPVDGRARCRSSVARGAGCARHDQDGHGPGGGRLVPGARRRVDRMKTR